MGHQAQVTIQVCLQDAIFVARYRALSLEHEDLSFGDGCKFAPKSVAADLRIRRDICANVILMLQRRKDAIEEDMRGEARRNAIEKKGIKHD